MTGPGDRRTRPGNTAHRELGGDCHGADIVRGDQVLFRAVVQTEA